LIEVLLNKFGANAQEIQENILDEVQVFAGDAPQFDDITLLVIARYEDGLDLAALHRMPGTEY
jgi:serine phosphatase RsbU (regulator of sigma subunit)